MRYSKFSEFLHDVQDLQFGQFEDVTFDIEDSDTELQRAMQDQRLALCQFAIFLRRKNGSATFKVLKVQDGLPMMGETYLRPGVLRTFRFHIRNAHL